MAQTNFRLGSGSGIGMIGRALGQANTHAQNNIFVKGLALRAQYSGCPIICCIGNAYHHGFFLRGKGTRLPQARNSNPVLAPWDPRLRVIQGISSITRQSFLQPTSWWRIFGHLISWPLFTPEFLGLKPELQNPKP